MRRHVACCLVVFAASLPAAVLAQDGGGGLIGGESDGGPDIQYDGASLSFSVGFRDQLELTTSRSYDGPMVRCAFYDALWDIVHIFPVTPYERDVAFILHCWYPTGDLADTWSNPVAGYPVPYVCCSPGLPPVDLVDDWVVALFARNSIEFTLPVPELSPAGEQVVGIPTWFAVTNNLDFASVSAAAGPVWVTITPTLRDVHWDFGNGVTLTCVEDVATTWDPELGDAQSSVCTHTFQSNGEGEPLDGVVTITWNIWMESSENTPAGEFWGVAQTQAPIVVAVRELQAVID